MICAFKYICKFLFNIRSLYCLNKTSIISQSIMPNILNKLLFSKIDAGIM